MVKPARNPLTRWNQLTEEVARALTQHSGRWGGEGRTLPPEIASRILKTLKNSRLPSKIADLCILSDALGSLDTTNEDVSTVQSAAEGLWNIKILAAAAGVGDQQEYGL
jgi:hypothetical protein